MSGSDAGQTSADSGLIPRDAGAADAGPGPTDAGPMDSGTTPADGGPMDSGPPLADGGGPDSGMMSTDGGITDGGTQAFTDVGTPCTSGTGCQSGICVSIGSGMSACSEPCQSVANCVSGWTCGALAGHNVDVCLCALQADVCDGKDNNCDGVIDDGPGPDQQCVQDNGTGWACVNGACACPQLCSGRCVNPQNDVNNCGGCGTTCATGASCTLGVCQCPTGQIACSGQCVVSDVTHCGSCGNACPTGASCDQGACFCPTGDLVCSGACVPSDVHNCGVCGNACPSGINCVSGLCECADGGVACDGTCLDILTNPQNCGECGHFCPGACSGGVCGCPDGGTACGSSCVDTTSDNGNCGACGSRCPGACQEGQCTCSLGQRLCGVGSDAGLYCTNTVPYGSNTDCGACGHACPAGALCLNADCLCPPGASVCLSGCAFLDRDPANCGSCGNMCAVTSTCVSGHCIACPTGEEASPANTCINPLTNPNYCGASLSGCPGEDLPDGNYVTLPCTGGACACPAGQTGCAQNTNDAGLYGYYDCTSLNSDLDNCGTCGHVCNDGLCIGGACTGSCPPATPVACNGSCVDTSSDPNNCGQCGVTCPAGVACNSGNCGCNTAGDAGESPLPFGCAGPVDPVTGTQQVTCVNIWSDDPANCGACGEACPAGVACQSGVCACPVSTTDQCMVYDPSTNGTSVSCVDEQTDPMNCGACGKQCPPGIACQGGVCACPGTGAFVCSTYNYATESNMYECTYPGDPNHCASSLSCGSACGAGATCEQTDSNGWTCACPLGQTDCGGCVDTASDPAHCGDCYRSCGAGETCVNGTCSCPSASGCGGAGECTVDSDCPAPDGGPAGACVLSRCQVGCATNSDCLTGATGSANVCTSAFGGPSICAEPGCGVPGSGTFPDCAAVGSLYPFLTCDTNAPGLASSVYGGEGYGICDTGGAPCGSGQPACPAGQVCDTALEHPLCVANCTTPTGASCTVNLDCESGLCDTATGQCATCPMGYSCDTTSGLCQLAAAANYQPCESTAQCPAGNTCYPFQSAPLAGLPSANASLCLVEPAARYDCPVGQLAVQNAPCLIPCFSTQATGSCPAGTACTRPPGSSSTAYYCLPPLPSPTPCTSESTDAFCAGITGNACTTVTAVDNCGATRTVSCGTTCASGATCSNGLCSCPTGSMVCDGACDSQSCGTCGNICPSGTACVSGNCECTGGFINCALGFHVPPMCVDPTTTSNCGGCSIICQPSASCVNGICQG